MTDLFNYAYNEYKKINVDAKEAIKKLNEIPISIHCWQGDDVCGFDGSDNLSGGIQTTGNYPGKARNFNELKEDIKKAFSLIPGKKRLNLHASYAILNDKSRDRDEYINEDFALWVEFAKEIGLDGIDFNPTIFSHPKLKDGLSLSSPDKEIRNFWIRHCISCLKIAEYFAREFNSYSLVNIWIPDGFKDVPSDRLVLNSILFKETFLSLFKDTL